MELFASETQTLRFKNVPEQTLIIQKYIKGTTTPLAGVEFLVRDSFGAVIGSENGRFVTNEDGQVVISGLVPGTAITVKETKTVEGYILDSTEKSIGIRSVDAQTLTFYNAPKGSLQIIKRDALTNEPLEGAEFQILKSNGEYVANNGGRLSSNGVYTTDASGQILLTELEPATLVVREVTAPAGYVLDDTPQTVELSDNETQTLTFRNVPVQTVTIRKFIEETTTPIQGVRFEITDGNGNKIGTGEYVTDENGEIILPGIAPGTTVVAREIKTIKGYSLNGMPKNITVRSGAENTLTFYDSPLSKLIIHKYISGTNNEPLAGAGFKIMDGTGKNIGTSDGIFYTDETGEIVISDLEPGTVVKVREISTIDGFVLDGTPKDIEIQSSDVHELTFRNQCQGSLTVRKLDSITREPVSGAEFRVTFSDGRPAGNNGVYTTDSNGEININGITGTVVITDVIWYERCLSRQNTHITIAAGHLWRMIALCMRKAAIPA